jgi:hypothetical protein
VRGTWPLAAAPVAPQSYLHLSHECNSFLQRLEPSTGLKPQQQHRKANTENAGYKAPSQQLRQLPGLAFADTGISGASPPYSSVASPSSRSFFEI